MYKKSGKKKKNPPARVNFYIHTRKKNAYICPDYEPKKKKSAARLSENILMRVTGNRAIFMDGLTNQWTGFSVRISFDKLSCSKKRLRKKKHIDIFLDDSDTRKAHVIF